jgi:hypothetical protein
MKGKQRQQSRKSHVLSYDRHDCVGTSRWRFMSDQAWVNTMLLNSSSRPIGARPRAERYRTVFISDLHLGTPGCKADCLLDFLQHVESEYLYLIGDVVDGWRLKKRWFWPERHSQVLQSLLARARLRQHVLPAPLRRTVPGQSQAGLGAVPGGGRIAAHRGQ